LWSFQLAKCFAREVWIEKVNVALVAQSMANSIVAEIEIEAKIGVGSEAVREVETEANKVERFAELSSEDTRLGCEHRERKA
jgi:hypothetical protein